MSYYKEFDRYIKTLSKKELCLHFPIGTVGDKKVNSFTNAYLMRSIIMNEKAFSPVDYSRSLREMWYSVVKPTLDKLELLTDDDQTEEGLTKWDATLSRYVAELVRGGYLTYKDLNISDTSRQKENPASYYSSVSISTYGYKVTISPYSNVIVLVEKDTVYQVVANLAKIFGLSCISAKGQSAFAAAEYLLRGMRGDFSTIYVVSFTDYDPAGYIIADSFGKQIEDMVLALGMECNVIIKRVGLVPTQLTDEQISANWYSPKGANGHPQKSVETIFDAWYENTGGINGNRKGLETEALSRQELLSTFVDALMSLGIINGDVYQDFIKRSFCDMLVLKALQGTVEALKEFLYDTYQNDIDVVDFDIAEIAKRGLSMLPIVDLCSTNNEANIEDFVKSCFSPISSISEENAVLLRAKKLLRQWIVADNDDAHLDLRRSTQEFLDN